MIIIDFIGEAAIYEQLAEECAELAKAALKKARILRGENPTPVSLQEADDNLIEEFADVTLCARELDLNADESLINYKKNRWINRIAEHEKDRGYSNRCNNIMDGS